jgi:hypothetical protein
LLARIRHPRRWLFLAIALLAGLLLRAALSTAEAPAGTSGCPPSSPAPLSRPSPPTSSVQPAAEEILVCIGPTPIIGATYSHWLAIAEKDAEPLPKGSRRPSAGEMRNEVLDYLISSYWVIEEAARLNVHVSEVEAKRSFDRIRAQQFPKRREFTAFLRQSGQTVADLLFRVKLNLLSTRIQRRVLAGHHGAQQQQRALLLFVRGFKARWKSVTYCEPQYVVADCGHTQSPL